MKEGREVQPGSVLHVVYTDIFSGIISGEYPPKSTLPTEGSLAKTYGVSRAMVRSALGMLKKQGVVRSQQGSGTTVACYDPRKFTLPDFNDLLPGLEDCVACRLAIEPEFAAQLAIRQSAIATAYLKTQLQDLDRQTHDAANPVPSGSAGDAEFHIRLAEYSGNRFFSSIMVTLRPHMLFSMNTKKYLSSQARKEHVALSRLEHKNVVEAILDRDAGAARELMKRHITHGRDRIFLQCQGR